MRHVFIIFRRSSMRLFCAILLIAVIALMDWHVMEDVPLGFLYLLPMVLLGTVLSRWQIAVAALLCSLLAEAFDPFAWSAVPGGERDLLYFSAFFAVGLLVHESTRSRRVILKHLREIEEQRDARRDAEEQLSVLIESSPAGILTTDGSGTVLMANEAAHRILNVSMPQLLGRSLRRYFPSLEPVLDRNIGQEFFRAVMQSRGQREDGESFLAEISFSTYRTAAGLRLAAMILDSSEEFRTREEASLHQMLLGSRIAVGAISHEMRNVCGAISMVHKNLSRNPHLTGDKDFEALGNLALSLERIASVDLRPYRDQASEVDVPAILEDLRIVIGPSLEDHDIQCKWEVEAKLPPVWADEANLMQVFLNLTTNSVRALSACGSERRMTIAAKSDGGRVMISVTDNGVGVPDPTKLFHPFQSGAKSTGLGLYLSRAFARSFGGDLSYRAMDGGACFVVELSAVRRKEERG